MPADNAFPPRSVHDPRDVLLSHLRTLREQLQAPPTPEEKPQIRQLIQQTIHAHGASRVRHPVLGLLLRNLLADFWKERVDAAYYARQIDLVAEQLAR